MAAARFNGGLLEQSRRVVRVALTLAAVFALLSVLALILRPRPEQVAGHA
jgi:hypothetical protein